MFIVDAPWCSVHRLSHSFDYVLLSVQKRQRRATKHRGEFNQFKNGIKIPPLDDAHSQFWFLGRFNYKTELLKNLTTGDAMVINVFNNTVMQGEKGITATVDLPSIDGEMLSFIPSLFI